MKAMPIRCYAVYFSVVLIAMLGGGCDKKSPAEQVAEDSNNAAKKTGAAIKDAAANAKDAVKDTAQKAVDAGKEGAQKVESAVTNIVGEIKQKVQ